VVLFFSLNVYALNQLAGYSRTYTSIGTEFQPSKKTFTEEWKETPWEEEGSESERINKYINKCITQYDEITPGKMVF